MLLQNSRLVQVALKLEPSARFIGKMEDDSVLHDSRVMAELMYSSALPGARQRRQDWAGRFQYGTVILRGYSLQQRPCASAATATTI